MSLGRPKAIPVATSTLNNNSELRLHEEIYFRALTARNEGQYRSSQERPRCLAKKGARASAGVEPSPNAAPLSISSASIMNPRRQSAWNVPLKLSRSFSLRRYRRGPSGLHPLSPRLGRGCSRPCENFTDSLAAAAWKIEPHCLLTSLGALARWRFAGIDLCRAAENIFRENIECLEFLSRSRLRRIKSSLPMLTYVTSTDH